jgi:hypothetical protein
MFPGGRGSDKLDRIPPKTIGSTAAGRNQWYETLIGWGGMLEISSVDRFATVTESWKVLPALTRSGHWFTESRI